MEIYSSKSGEEITKLNRKTYLLIDRTVSDVGLEDYPLIHRHSAVTVALSSLLVHLIPVTIRLTLTFGSKLLPSCLKVFSLYCHSVIQTSKQILNKSSL